MEVDSDVHWDKIRYLQKSIITLLVTDLEPPKMSISTPLVVNFIPHQSQSHPRSQVHLSPVSFITLCRVNLNHCQRRCQRPLGSTSSLNRVYVVWVPLISRYLLSTSVLVYLRNWFILIEVQMSFNFTLAKTLHHNLIHNLLRRSNCFFIVIFVFRWQGW